MKTATRVRLRKILFVFHLWTGLGIGLYLVMLGLTGSILVFRPELEERMFPEFVHVASPSAEAKPLPASKMVAAVRRAFPGIPEEKLATLEMPRHPGAAFSAQAETPDGQTFVTLDPYTGKVISRGPYDGNIVALLGNLHMYLLMEAQGMLINTFGGLLAALLIGSGLWLWWPATVRQIRARLTVKRGVSVKRLMNDLHNVFGMYGLAFLVMASVTGAIFGIWEPVQGLVNRATGSPDAPAAPSSVPIGAARLPLERLVAIAEETGPDARLSSITYPTKPDQPFSAWKITDQGLFLYVSVTIDPYTGKVLQHTDSRKEPVGGQIMRWVQMLHFGWWGGWPSKIPYALLGLLPLGLFATGVGRYWLRWKQKAGKAPGTVGVGAASGIERS